MNTTPHPYTVDPGFATSWPHTVFSFRFGIVNGQDHSGRILETSGSKTSTTGFDRAALKASITEIKERSRRLKLADLSECVLCFDLLDTMPKDNSFKEAVGQTFKDTGNLPWLLITHHPEQAVANLSKIWENFRCTNVSVATVLTGDVDENRQRIQALRKIPFPTHTLWVRNGFHPESLDGWHENVRWVIADQTGDDSVVSPKGASDWALTIRNACHKQGIPCFRISPNGVDRDTAGWNVAGVSHHPFKAAINLYEDSPYGRLSSPKSSTSPVRPPALEEVIPYSTTTEQTLLLVDSDSSPVVVSSPRPSDAPPIDTSAEAIVVDAEKSQLRSGETVGKSSLERFKKLDGIVREGIRATAEAGNALMVIRDEELWRDDGYATWNSYCETLLEFGRSYVNRLIGHATITRELIDNNPPSGPDGAPILPAGESLSRPLKKLPDSKKRAKAWRQAVKSAGGMPTAKIVIAVVDEIMPAASPRPSLSRIARRKELEEQLQDAVDAAVSWERVREIVSQLLALN